jgi:hypothetical protein
MRSHTILTALLCVTALTTTGKAETNLYVRSLAAFVQHKQTAATNVDSLVVVKNVITGDPAFSYGAPSEVGPTRLEYLDTKSLVARFRQIGKPFPAIAINPIANQDGTLVVDCAEYRVSARRRKAVLSVSGGTLIRWRFDAATRDYVMTAAEPWRFTM